MPNTSAYSSLQLDRNSIEDVAVQPTPRTSFPLIPKFAAEVMARWGWTIPETKARHWFRGLPLKVTGTGKGRRYELVISAVNEWVMKTTVIEPSVPLTAEEHHGHRERFRSSEQQSGARGRRRI